MGEAVDVGRVEARDVEALAERLVEFVKPYQEGVGWTSREKHLGAFVAVLLGGTERKSVEPIALAQGVDRRQLQHFVGVSPWDHGPLLGRLQQEVGDEIGDPQGALVVDGSAMPKKGTESVGVTRQWCGRLGKVENCQLGVFLAYAGKDSSTLVDERLYLPRAWTFDEERRRKAKVPAAVTFKKPWEVADEMLRHVGPRLPHRWIVGDAEFGRSTAFRDRLAKRGERYVLEVPSTMVVRKVARPKVGRPPTWHRVSYFLRGATSASGSASRFVTGRRSPLRWSRWRSASRPAATEDRRRRRSSRWRPSAAKSGGCSCPTRRDTRRSRSSSARPRGGTSSRRRSRTPKVRWGSITTRCALGAAGTTI